MTEWAKVPPETIPVHQLLISDTKLGKSTYAAQAILDGMPAIYLDADNGASALQRAFGRRTDFQHRLLYFKTNQPCVWLEELLEQPIFKWNITQDTPYQPNHAKPGDSIVIIIPSRIPHWLLFIIDSWSAVALDAMGLAADDKSTTLIKMGDDKQGIYGDANLRLTVICARLQHVKFHTLTQAHGVIFERFEKPLGRQDKDNLKQKNMILKETIKVPVSSSRPHGQQMAKYFNQIGWIELNRSNERILDYTVAYDRIGGGSLDRAAEIEELPFVKSFGLHPPKIESIIDPYWIRYATHAELAVEAEAARESAKPASVSADGKVLPAQPANKTVSSLLRKQ